MKKYSELKRKFQHWVARKYGIKVTMQGVLSEVCLTFGGPGNQWTTIGGDRYATYWNVFQKDWMVGDRVKYDAFYAPLMGGSYPVFQADNIRKINDENGSLPSAGLEPVFV